MPPSSATRRRALNAAKIAIWLLALALACCGTLLLNAPSSMGGGPFAIDLGFPLGFVVAGLSMLVVERTRPPEDFRRVAYGIAALALFIAAGRSFYAFPPLQDGALLLLRYSRDPEVENLWPAGPLDHAIAFAPFEWALFLALRSEVAAGDRGASWTSFAARSATGIGSVVAATIAIDRQAQSLIASERGSTTSLAAVAAMSLAALPFARRSESALLVAIVGWTTVAAMAACTWLLHARA